MPDLSGDIRTRVASLANRLRLVQADFADDDAKSRQEALEDTVERELSSVEPGLRESFLAALAECFPSWDSNVAATGTAPVAAVQSRTDERELQDPSFLVSRLIALAGKMGEADRQAAAEKLKAAGFMLQGEGGLPAEASKQLQTFLGHGPKDKLDAGRVVELARLGAEFIASVDKSVSASWKAVATNSRIRHAAGAKATMARFATGDSEVTRTQVQQELDRLRTLAGGLMSAVERAGEQFAQRHLERFSPSEIEAMAKLVPGAFVALEAKCWRKYKELAEHHDKAAIEQDIRTVIAEYTERLIEGLGR